MKRLTKLANKFGTDKGSTFESKHEYTEIYEDYFNKYENPVILEIGSGEGASAKMFNAFYDGDCEIYSLDIKEMNFEEENIHYLYIDTDSDESVDEVAKKLENIRFDIIIDDGSHISEHQCRCLKKFYKLLKNNGIYIIEDLYSNVQWMNFNESLLNFLVTGYDIHSFTQDEKRDLINNIKSLALYKRKNQTLTKWGFVDRSITAILNFEQK